MKKTIALLLVPLLLLSIMASGGQEKVRVLLKFKDAPDSGLVEKAGGRVLHEYSLLDDVLAVEVTEPALQGILKNPNVLGFEPDVEVHALGKPVPSQPMQQLPWGVDRVDAELSPYTGNGVKACVVDTGIQKDHPDLQANLLEGRNFIWARGRLDAGKWGDDNGHGTHVAGTIAALDNSIGVVGVAKNAKLLAAKVLNRQGSGYLSDVIAGIDYCVSAGADVVSMSLGTSSDVQAMHDAVDRAYAAGLLVVAAAGNDYGGAVSYPAAYSSVIAVSATDSSDNLAGFSSVGPEVELSAPGTSVLSTWIGSGYNTISGTSMATPHVSGAAALAFEANPLLSNAEIRVLLQNTSDDLGAPGRDSLFGFGLVDAKLA